MRPPRQPLAASVLAVVGHPRYGGDFIPLWRIREAVPAGPSPIGIHREIERLEAAGMVERRWSATGSSEGSSAPLPSACRPESRPKASAPPLGRRSAA